MTPPDVLSRALAAALLDGEWKPAPMRRRLREAMGADRPWMRALTRAARSRYATAPAGSLEELAAWLATRPAFGDALRDRMCVVHYATPAPEMAASPWPVPALATLAPLARQIIAAAKHSQVIVVSHAAPLVDAIAAARDATRIELVNENGETLVSDRNRLDEPPWKWTS